MSRSWSARDAYLIRAVALTYAIGLGYLIVLFKGTVLPARFGLDSDLIRRLAESRLVTGDRSYDSTARVYRELGLADNPTVVGLLGYTLAVVVLLLVARRVPQPQLTGSVLAMLCVSIVLSAVYLGFYSKDVFVLAVSAAVLLAPANRRGLVAVTLVTLAYAYFFRSYWFITIGAFAGVLWLVARRTRPLRTVAAIALVVTALGVAIYLFKDVPPDHYRDVVNDARIGDTNANTLIHRFVDLPEPLGGLVNNLLTAAALVVPVPLLGFGKLYYAVLAVAIFVTWALFILAFLRLQRAPTVSPVTCRAAAMVISFLMTQAIFEPDYGSAQRHLAPLLPLMLLVVWTFPARATRPEGQPADPTRGTKDQVDNHRLGPPEGTHADGGLGVHAKAIGQSHVRRGRSRTSETDD